MSYPTTLFYELHVKDATFHFVFRKRGLVNACIELTNPLLDNETIVIHVNKDHELTAQEVVKLHKLAASPKRLQAEAITMLREYMQGASGSLPVDDKYGQMIFGMDAEDIDQIC